MVYRVTAKFYFDNNQVKRIDWLESNLIKKGTNEYLTREEVVEHFRALFYKLMKENGLLAVPCINGKVAVVPLSKVNFVELYVKEELGGR